MRNPSKKKLIKEIRRLKALSNTWKGIIAMEQASVEYWKKKALLSVTD